MGAIGLIENDACALLAEAPITNEVSLFVPHFYVCKKLFKKYYQLLFISYIYIYIYIYLIIVI